MNVFTQLAAEWERLNGDAAARATIAGWADPALDGCRSPADVLRIIRRSDYDHTDAALLTLIRLAGNGDQLAGRIALQAMLPGLAALTRRIAGGLEGDDAAQQVIGEFWQVLAGYPYRRRQRVAANLLWDTLRAVHRPTRPTRRIDPALVSDPAGAHDSADLRAVPSLDPDTDLDGLLAWATEHGVVDARDAGLLSAVYTDRQPRSVVAHRLGLTEPALRKRCSRSRLRLQIAVRTELAHR